MAINYKVNSTGLLNGFTHVADTWSPNYYTNACPSDGITIHHYAGLSYESAANRFIQPAQQASAHYGVGPGKYTQYVSEQNGAWHGGADFPNFRTIGIETVNSTGAPDWKVDDRSIDTLVHLMADIAIRHGWAKLEYKKNVWGHRDFSATACPGPYLYPMIPQLCAKANAIIEEYNRPKIPAFKSGVFKALRDIKIYKGQTTGSGEVGEYAAGSYFKTTETLVNKYGNTFGRNSKGYMPLTVDGKPYVEVAKPKFKAGTYKLLKKLNLRSSATTTKSNIVGKLEKDSYVIIVSTSINASGNTWGKTASGKYIAMHYSGEENVKLVKPAFTSGMYEITSTTGLNCREGYSTSTKKVCVYAYKKQVKVTSTIVNENGNTWGKTDKGYIAMKYTNGKTFVKKI